MGHQIWLLLLVILTTLTSSALTARIIGGEKALPGQFPYVAFLTRINNISDSSACSASILSTTWALSAAHCTDLPGSLVLTAGTVSITDDNPNTQERLVTRYIKHPQYQNVTVLSLTFLIFDISLLQVEEPFQWNEFVKPINLENQVRGYGPGECVAVGFGHSNMFDPGSLGELRFLNFSRYEVKSCVNAIPLFPSEHHLCSLDVGYVFSGDSGGPLVCNDKQAGIAIMGLFFPLIEETIGLHTSVPHFYQWITDNTDVPINDNFDV